MSRGRARAHALVTSLSLSALASACTLVEPETGERLAACVDADSDPSRPVSFKEQIRPIMKGPPVGPRPCSDCHVPGKGTQEGFDAVNLNLASLGTIRLGGRNSRGTIIVPGKPCSSVLVQKLRGTFTGARMPKNGPYWSREQIQLVTDWIAEGAQGADDE